MDKYIEELLPFYALGALTDEEKGLVESYLEEHPEVRAEVEGMQFAASALPYGVTPVEPSERPKKALMARIAADQRSQTPGASPVARTHPATPQSRAIRFPQFAFGALSLLAAATAIVLLVISNRQVSSLREEVAALKNAVVAQQRTADQLNQAINDVNARLPQEINPSLTLFEIQGTTVQPDAHGQLIFDPNNASAVLVVTALAPLESGKTYQVWLIEGETPVSAGLLQVDANGQGVAILDPEQAIDSFDAVGISIEPVGGSQLPTGDIVMLGQFTR
ncbi:MAG: anti-sigma factor [Chloroflexota bacterium]